jgi:gamma-glutamyltranspeptidase/glutathione hydrolase
VQLLEGLHLLELAGPGRERHFSDSPADLARFIDIARVAYAITYSPSYRPFPGDAQAVPWIAPKARVDRRHAALLLARLARAGWEDSLAAELAGPASHSDALVARDARGDIVVLVHSINTSLWGSTGLFVDGVSIPDPASFQQDMVARAGPGRRLPNVVNPVIVLRDGVPLFAAGAIGNALHECILQAIVSVVDYGMDPGGAMSTPSFWGPWWGGAPGEYARQAVDPGFAPRVLEETAALGRPCRVLAPRERPKRVSYWIGVRFGPEGRVRGAISPDFNGRFEVLLP